MDRIDEIVLDVVGGSSKYADMVAFFEASS